MRQPLQVRIKFYVGRMFEREACGGSAVHVAELLRPVHPTRCASERRAKMAIERIEPRVQLQRCAPLLNEAQETACSRAACCELLVAKILVKQRQDLKFQICDTAIIHEVACAQSLQAPHALKVGHT